MEQIREELAAWISDMENHQSPQWEKLPEIDLYMDQVTALLEHYLDSFMLNTDDKLITPSMVNNYVKQGLIDPPVKKKYSRKHLAYLMAVCILKQVLPISSAAALLNAQRDLVETSELFNLFSSEQDTALKNVAGVVASICENLSDESSDMELSMLALKLAVSANANRLAAERILQIVRNNSAKGKKESEGKSK